MEIFTKSEISWTEPKSFYEYYDKKLSDLNPTWKLFIHRYVFPTVLSVITVLLIFLILKVLLDTKYFAFTTYFCLVAAIMSTLIIQFVCKYVRKSIYIYKDKILIYDGDKKTSMKFNDIKGYKIEGYKETGCNFRYITFVSKSGKKLSAIIDPKVDTNNLNSFLKSKII